MAVAVAEQYWQNAKTLLERVLKVGANQYFNSQTEIKRAFSLSDRSLRCIDEGTPGGIHLAGSGILLDIDRAVEYSKRARVDGVYSHEDCGAVDLYAELENLDPAFADEYGREWAKTLAKRLKVPYNGHIPIAKMARPRGRHIAAAAYYDATGEFDYSAISTLPVGFIISRKYLDDDYAKTELKTALKIALGSHGFGQKFSKELPFLIIVLAKTEKALKETAAEAEETAAEFREKVKVERVNIG